MKKLALPLTILIVVVTLTNVPKTQAATATVTITSAYNINTPGMTFLINITISGVTGLSAWLVNMTWDSSMVRITTGDLNGLYLGGIYYNIYEGPFLKNVRPTTGLMVREIDNTNGKIRTLSCSFIGSGNPANGDGILVTINFTCVNVGTSTLHINGPSNNYPGHSAIVDPTGKEMPVEDRDGTVTSEEPPAPPIWMEPWFPAVILIIVVIGAVFVIFRKKIL